MQEVFSHSGNGFLVSGRNQTTCFDDLWIYNPTSDSWAQGPDLPGLPRFVAAGFNSPNGFHIGTGRDIAGNYFDDWMEFDMNANQWNILNNFPSTPRSHAIAFSIPPYGYIGTGISSANNYFRDFYRIDLSTGNWTATAMPGNSRKGAAAFVINSKACGYWYRQL
ncbi:MAG: hypothetical protein IPG39_19140 [Bacteroidetes bacterium]|nr:hypothetical protein [Bacteroidota bacterium]